MKIIARMTTILSLFMVLASFPTVTAHTLPEVMPTPATVPSLDELSRYSNP